MTKEQAIKELKIQFVGEYDRQREAKDVAIKALEQEPCEDCVSRAEVLEIYDEWFATCNIANRKASPKAKINALPPVTPTHKKGKWLGNKAYPICPKCNCNIIEEYISCSDFAEMYKPMKFCPNCGAEMSEVEE